jgi:hypothetical protein
LTFFDQVVDRVRSAVLLERGFGDGFRDRVVPAAHDEQRRAAVVDGRVDLGGGMQGEIGLGCLEQGPARRRDGPSLVQGVGFGCVYGVAEALTELLGGQGDG